MQRFKASFFSDLENMRNFVQNFSAVQTRKYRSSLGRESVCSKLGICKTLAKDIGLQAEVSL